jgi:hypothetical protein
MLQILEQSCQSILLGGFIDLKDSNTALRGLKHERLLCSKQKIVYRTQG